MLKWLKSNHNSVTALGAITVSMIALFVAWDQSRVMRAQQHAEVWPALQIESSFMTADDLWTVVLQVTNDGIGPAIVESASASIEDTSLNTWEDLQQFLSPDLDTRFFTGYAQREILAPGETSIMARMTWENPTDEDKRLNHKSELLGKSHCLNLTLSLTI